MTDNKRSWINAVIVALVIGYSITVARASSTGAHNPESLVDCLNSRGMPSDTASRRRLAEADTHAEMRESLPYRRTRKQNLHLLRDVCPHFVSGVSRIARHPKVSAREQAAIISDLRLIARTHGVDDEKFVNTARCESDFYSRALGDGGHSRGIFQFHKKYRGEVSDSVAYNPHAAALVAVKDFFTEGWRKHYVKVRDTQGNVVFNRNGKPKYKWDGTYYWRSETQQWSCYRKLYGNTSARIIPSESAPAWAHSSRTSVIASNSD